MFAKLLLASMIAVTAAGCTAGLHGGERVVKFRERDAEAFARAPRDGQYVVAFRQDGTEEMWAARGTRRELKRGDDLGFIRDASGAVVAVAGERERTLGPMPMIAQYACWYRLPDDYDRNRQVRKGLRETAKVTGAVALVGGAAIGVSAVDGALDNRDEDGERWTVRKDNRSRGR
jgi:hypothetical protein